MTNREEWPPDWYVEVGPDGAVLTRDESAEDGAKDEQTRGEPAASDIEGAPSRPRR